MSMLARAVLAMTLDLTPAWSTLGEMVRCVTAWAYRANRGSSKANVSMASSTRSGSTSASRSPGSRSRAATNSLHSWVMATGIGSSKIPLTAVTILRSALSAAYGVDPCPGVPTERSIDQKAPFSPVATGIAFSRA